MKNALLAALPAMFLVYSDNPATHAESDPDQPASVAVSSERIAPRTFDIPAGKWIGGLKVTDVRVLAAFLDATSTSRILSIWLRTGELRVFSLEEEQSDGLTLRFRTAKGDNVCSGSFNGAEFQGDCSLASENIRGPLTLVKVSTDSRAASLYNHAWQEGFLGPEAYHFLATSAAARGDIAQALLWLKRGRSAKTPMSDALLFSDLRLADVRRDPRFREIFQDPVAVHPELSQATYTIRVDRDVPVAMRDQARLLADIYRPDSSGRFPAILIRGPYGRGADIPPDGVAHFAARGYVVVIQSVRGTAGSQGEFQPWLNERKDGYDTIDWASRQEWSNGRVCMMGLSYLGQTQWAAAVEGHPALKCIIPEVSGTDHMLDTPYDHGVLRLDLLSWALGMIPRPKGQFSRPKLDDGVLTSLPLSTLDRLYAGQTLPVWQGLLDLDKASQWSSANFLSDLTKVHIPVLNISGWWDGEASATTRNYTAMRALGRENQWLIYGPWAHVWNQSTKFRDQEYGPTAKIDFQSLSVRWFDQWLKQKRVNFDSIPRVQVFVTGANQWKSLTDWPDPHARSMNMYLANSGPSCTVGLLALSSSHECSGPNTYEYNAEKVNPLGNGLIPDTSTTIPLNLTAADMLVYESGPFETATTLSTPGTLDLWFSTSAHDVDFFVVVFDRDLSGVARALAGPGKMGMRYIDGWDAPHPLTPNQVYHGTIDLRPFAHRFEKGHHVGFFIRSEWFPGYVRNLNTGAPVRNGIRMELATETIFHDSLHPSVLRLWHLDDK
jgi:putative CocE/NonD family hydrolase